MIEIRPFEAAYAPIWNTVVLQSRSGNLLHLRHYMEYHADRFVDQSLIVVRKGQPVAVFPASQDGEAIVSHGGLSYAGLISTPALRAEATLAALEHIATHYRQRRYTKLLYKAIPHVFHRYPTEEDLYGLFRLGARLVRRDLSSVIDIGRMAAFPSLRTRSVSNAKKKAITVGRGTDLETFHGMLSERAEQLGRMLTHSAAELRLLSTRFPQEIVLHEARDDDGRLLAGVLIYDFGPTVHTQYIGASDTGRAMSALDVLLIELIDRTYADRRFFSLGISTEHSGRFLNEGLVTQKERFGARAVTHDFYELDL
ncbi:GNAT family N-acetyltransferase [Bradyrhizobium ganzhouense]|uniref:GNAT family N-acetyltransferase n=1 Tax=Bradyrhizobium ganzhouense TaxID=1179767 RepID=UPI003CEE3238